MNQSTLYPDLDLANEDGALIDPADISDEERDIAIVDETGDPAFYKEAQEVGAPPAATPIQNLLKNIMASIRAKTGATAKSMKFTGTRRDLRRAKGETARKVVATPAGVAKIKALAKIDKIARPTDIYYTRVKNGIVKFDNRGSVINRMRPAEVYTLMGSLFSGPPYPSEIHSFPAPTLGVTTLPMSQVANLVDGALWTGYILTFEVPQLNLVTNSIIEVQTYMATFDPTGATPSFVQRFQMSGTSTTTTITSVLTVMSNARPRFAQSYLAASDVGPNALNRIDIVGLPSNYTAKVRLLVPGEADVEQFINVL